HRFPIRERPRISLRAQALLRDVGNAIADVEGRVALAVEIEVEQVEPLTVEQRVVGIEVAMDAAWRTRRRRRAEAITGGEQPPQPPRPLRSRLPQCLQAAMQYAQLVGHGVPAPSRHACLMQL